MMAVWSNSPPWSLLLLLLLPMLGVEGREVGSSSSRVNLASWASCQQTVCSRVRDEAEGLARLKLLRGYVTETVRLLDSLMESMDNELVDIAKEMKDFVGPRCETAHQLLGQVAEAMPQRDQELSAGIMEESTAQRVVAAQSSGRHELDSDIEQHGYDSDTQGWGRSEEDSGHYSSSTDRQGNTGHQSSFSNRRGSSSSLGWGVENTANSVYSAEEEDSQDTYDGQDGYRSGYGGGRQNLGGKGNGRQLDQGNSGGWSRGTAGAGAGTYKGGNQRHYSAEETYETSGSNQYNSAVSHDGNSGSRVVSGGSSSSSSWRPVQSGPNCKGLRGSPFAVPGIDDWCLQNCARGYCPLTHCTCQ